ncbi:MAG: ATP-dependent helicase, partial [Planctomycetes bacterium]|nr:ATP-dependent helicase [Planctomycetota bacterium]
AIVKDLIEHEGIDYNDVAVFYRTNAQSRALEQGLREAGIPYVIVGSVEFYKRKEIVDVLAWLRLLINPTDEQAFGRAIANPGCGVGEASAAKIVAAARARGINLIDAVRDPDVLALLRGKPAAGARAFGEIVGKLAAMPKTPATGIVSQVISLTGYESWIMRDDPARGLERVENVQELVSDAAIFDETNRGATLADYVERVSLINDIDKYDPGKRAVSLMTLHSAKGLEFPAVFIAGVEDGSIPHMRSITGDSGNLEEERRLLYVGITRAKRFLHLTLARHREQFGQSTRNSPSRFLRELPQELLAQEDHTGGLFGVGLGGVKPAAVESLPFDDDVEPASDDDGAAAPDPWEGADTGPGLRLLRKEPLPAEPPRPEIVPGGMVNADLNVGDRVRHQMFGVGKILSFTPHAGGTRARILFTGWGEKNMALEYARLERIEPAR